jgi:hypothetical protein
MKRKIFKNKYRDIEKIEKRFMNFGLKFIMSAKPLPSFSG